MHQYYCENLNKKSSQFRKRRVSRKTRFYIETEYDTVSMLLDLEITRRFKEERSLALTPDEKIEDD